jgi:hypothetical protein
MPIDDRKGLRDLIMEEMTTGDGIAVHPVFVAVGHGFHSETGADQITFGSYDDKSKHLLTQVMPLDMAREACENLAKQIAAVDKLNAARRNTNGQQEQHP